MVPRSGCDQVQDIPHGNSMRGEKIDHTLSLCLLRARATICGSSTILGSKNRCCPFFEPATRPISQWSVMVVTEACRSPAPDRLSIGFNIQLITFDATTGFQVERTVVPGPGALPLMAGALMVLGWCRRRADVLYAVNPSSR